MRDALISRAGVLSTQILQEFFAVATRKLGVAPAIARRKVELLSALDVVRIDVDQILGAIDLYRLHSISFRDALVLQCAAAAGCGRLLSEDLQHGQLIAAYASRIPSPTCALSRWPAALAGRGRARRERSCVNSSLRWRSGAPGRRSLRSAPVRWSPPWPGWHCLQRSPAEHPPAGSPRRSGLRAASQHLAEDNSSQPAASTAARPDANHRGHGAAQYHPSTTTCRVRPLCVLARSRDPDCIGGRRRHEAE